MLKHLQIAWNHAFTQDAKAEFKRYLKSIHSSLNGSLFDASTTFWSYHLVGIALLLFIALTLNSLFTPSYMWDFYFLAQTVWAIGLFFAGLILRSHYQRENWEQVPHTVVLLKTIASCIFFSFFVVLAISVTSINFYFDDFYRYYSHQYGTSSSIKLIGEFFLDDALYRNHQST